MIIIPLVIAVLVLLGVVIGKQIYAHSEPSAKITASLSDCGAAVPNGGLVALQANGFTPRGSILLTTTRNDQPIKFASSVPVNVLGKTLWFFGCRPGHDGKIKITGTDRDTGRSATVTFTVPDKLAP